MNSASCPPPVRACGPAVTNQSTRNVKTIQRKATGLTTIKSSRVQPCCALHHSQSHSSLHRIKTPSAAAAENLRRSFVAKKLKFDRFSGQVFQFL
jgi:hypothetical protein